MSVRLIVFLGLVLATRGAIAAEKADADALFVFFIQPMLKEKCLACHGDDAKKIKSAYDMRTPEGLMKGGESGEAAVVPGEPDRSPFFLSVTRTHEDVWKPMPPKENDRLTADQVGYIKQWIAAGAPWPDEARRAQLAKSADKWTAHDGITVKTVGALSADWANRRYKVDGLWAYQPVKKPAIDPQPGQNPIDALIAAKLPADLKPAPPCDARTFIRRATFDLTGLPPTPDDVETFVKAHVADADGSVKSLVDRLLSSPHYGERMAQHWLDVTRYADSSGFANDYERGNAWRYRDYVIRAFNSDKPYDQFVKEQIAGDELQAGSIKDEGGSLKSDSASGSHGLHPSEGLIATGFLRMGPWELTGMEVAKIARQRFLDDVTNSVGETFLAHSLQCARCHDHKFDPIPTHDYYSVQAVFGTTQLSERSAPFLPMENTAGFEERKFVAMRRVEHETMLAKLDEKLLANAQTWFADKKIDPAKWNAAVAQARKNPKANVTAKGKRREFANFFEVARGMMQQQGVAEDQYPPKLVGFTPDDYGNERVARKGLERLRWEQDRYEPFALSVYNGRTPDLKAVLAPMRMAADRMTNGELEETCIHPGGDPFTEGAKVSPGTLSVLAAFDPRATATIPKEIEGRRRAFAEWVADANNALTTRAISNRIWMWHFGQPIAGNPNNFGSTGKKPTHPELLDWLAATLVENGWSIKAMHRAIMSSDAYRRSSQFAVRSAQSKDDGATPSAEHPALGAKNLVSREELETIYAVFKPRRLTAEELRDAALAATGELNAALGGIPNRPEINLEAALQPRQVMGTFASAWTPNPLPQQRHRRSIYALKLRGLVDPTQEVFNAPAPDFSCERRDASTVTPQVFSLFNSQASYSRALALAARVLKSSKDDADAVGRCFALVYGRAPDAEELAAALSHWRAMEPVQARVKITTGMPPLEVRRDAVEENTGEKFSFQEQLHAIAEFVPDLQPSDVDARTRALGDVCLALFNSNEFAYVY